MEHHEEEPLIYLVDPPVRRHHKRSAVQGECMYCIELDVGIVQISQGSFESVIRSAGLDSDICGTIFYRSLRYLGFAEDIDIIGRTTAKVCMAYIRLKRDRAQLGGSVVECDNLEVVKEFCFLGKVVTSDYAISSECRRRIV